MKEKKILLFHISEKKTEEINALCRDLQIETVQVERSRYYEFLGTLAGIPGLKGPAPVYRGEELSGEMLVFFGLDSEDLDIFLAEYRKRGIEKIDLKAVMTPHNMTWNPLKLYEELSAEHTAMKTMP